ncbi:hypothetical protein KP696_23430 [Nocardia seriolae]|nr:hypothetical protein [Nocardia seriolae]MTJ75164.1 hypothetical protein [Nocardia seriolae]MTJ86659.1 hypothetical protein [Nocardia seriolae]MTK30654.1 hypothetical protein [Nocardia seriolae]MTK39607.1 hypothetical protein [Nocardia seriolae]
MLLARRCPPVRPECPMSTRTKPQPLSDTEIRQIAAEIDAGRPPMVWFTASAVGVPEGRSGKVMSLGDPSEGDFLQVKPTGSKDVLSFGPTEVTLTKPARQTTTKPANASSAAKPTGTNPKPATRKESPVTMSTPVTSPAPAPSPAPAAPEAKTEAPQPAAESAPEAKATKPAASRPARNAAAAKKPAGTEVTVTLSGTAEGEWTLDVVNGKKRTIKGLAVASSAVSQAAKILHPEFAEVVDSIHEAVRAAQQAKVEQLQAELESARRLLEDLA